MIDKGKNNVASNQTRLRTFVSSTVLLVYFSIYTCFALRGKSRQKCDPVPNDIMLAYQGNFY